MLARYKVLYLAGHKTSSHEMQELWGRMTLRERQDAIVWLFVRSIPDLVLAQHVMTRTPRTWN